jgi:hypothetical protein
MYSSFVPASLADTSTGMSDMYSKYIYISTYINVYDFFRYKAVPLQTRATCYGICIYSQEKC